MSDRKLKLLLIDPDLIYRTGLRLVLDKFSDLQVVSEAETATAGLQILAQSSTNNREIGIDLVLLELRLEPSQLNQSLGLQLCQQLKTVYSNLPVLLLSSVQDTQLVAARQAGVNGYCRKGIPVSELVTAIRQVAAQGFYWSEDLGFGNQESEVKISPATRNIVITLWNRLPLSGLQQIDASLTEVTAKLQVPGLSLLEQAFLAGQRRELLASRWLVKQMLASPEDRNLNSGIIETVSPVQKLFRIKNNSEPRTFQPQRQELPILVKSQTSSQVIRTLQFALFESVRAKLQFNLENLTRVPLEIDILREEKKRELLAIILQKIENVLEELRFSQVQLSQLREMRLVILRDLWQAATIDFFGKYSTLRLGGENVEFVNLLLQDAVVVEVAILAQTPLVVDLFSYLLFETSLVIDNIAYPAGSLEGKERAGSILQNLLIQVANSVVQPLLNRFADVEVLKQSFYDRRLISTREIERFRNNLSWKYRWGNYIGEPKAVFESRYELFVLVSRGIAKISVYAPRGQELTKLSRIQLAVTLALETRDAIAPRIRSVVAFLGSSVVYVLTQVIGRAIGLIGRGIVQGLGGSLPDNRNKRF